MSGTGPADTALAAAIAEEAGQLLLALRADGCATGAELGRRGDAESNALLLRRLAEQRPTDAVLSEESADSAVRLTADRVWIIDPLDGTREFGMPPRTDWAVHVALWERRGAPAAGITAAAVAMPALGTVYSTGSALAAAPAAAVLLVSASRPPSFADEVAAAIGAEVRPMGSAGAKAMAVLRGEAMAYLHAGGQWEWDSAAPAGVALAAGLHASRIDGSSLRYNSPRPYLPDLLICRPEVAGALLAAVPRG